MESVGGRCERAAARASEEAAKETPILGQEDLFGVVKERVACKPEWIQQRSCCRAWLKRACSGKLLLISTHTLRTVTRI